MNKSIQMAFKGKLNLILDPMSLIKFEKDLDKYLKDSSVYGGNINLNVKSIFLEEHDKRIVYFEIDDDKFRDEEK